MSCPFRKPKLLYFYAYAPGFNSNVDVIISLRTYFANMRFVKPPPVRKNNPTSAYSVIIFMNPT